jgi:hypothetical protein
MDKMAWSHRLVKARPVLPFNFLTMMMLILLSSVTIVRELRENWLSPTTVKKRDLGAWGQKLQSIVTPETAASIESDPQLKRSLLTLVDLTVELSNTIEKRFKTPEVAEAHEIIQTYRRSLAESLQVVDGEAGNLDEAHALTVRQLFPSFGGNNGAGAGGESALATLFSPITDALSGAISGIGNSALAALPGPLFFLGVGLGAGSAQGLELASNETIMQVTKKVAQDSGMEATGLNPAVQSLGMGLTATIIGSVNTSSLTSGIDIPGVALALGSGLGNGTAVGLQLSSVPMEMMISMMNMTNDTSIAGAVGMLGFGLTSSVTSAINTTKLIGMATSGDAANSFMMALPEAAKGLGTGLGEGASIGLGLQSEPAEMPPAKMPDGSVNVGGVVQVFARGLTSGFLQNGTLSKAASSLGNMAVSTGSGGISIGGMSVDVGKAAQGFAMGFLQGAGDAVQSMGGVGALLNGTATRPASGVPNSTIQFDDSVGGAAAGFGLGIGGQGVFVAQQLISNPNGGATPSQNSATVPMAAPAAAGSLAAPATARLRRRVTTISARQQTSPVSVDTTNGFNLSVILNAQTISTGAQMGVDALTCQGVGGLGLVLLGLVRSNTISVSGFSLDANTTDMIKQLIPNGTISVSNEGNTYEIDGQQVSAALDGNVLGAANGVAVNGMKVIAWAAMLVIHRKVPYTFHVLSLGKTCCANYVSSYHRHFRISDNGAGCHWIRKHHKFAQ